MSQASNLVKNQMAQQVIDVAERRIATSPHDRELILAITSDFIKVIDKFVMEKEGQICLKK